MNTQNVFMSLSTFQPHLRNNFVYVFWSSTTKKNKRDEKHIFAESFLLHKLIIHVFLFVALARKRR